ncbi:MAG TPA: hypothetical protein VJJ83_00270 [Candidatus Babeliales bacterium]|nr:hypothetical protein [Candidatus Babeliales bacterium]
MKKIALLVLVIAGLQSGAAVAMGDMLTAEQIVGAIKGVVESTNASIKQVVLAQGKTDESIIAALKGLAQRVVKLEGDVSSLRSAVAATATAAV